MEQKVDLDQGTKTRKEVIEERERRLQIFKEVRLMRRKAFLRKYFLTTFSWIGIVRKSR